MATITKRIKADGSIVYKAGIVIKKDGVIIHRESKTFDKTKLAKDWSMRREVELQNTDVYAKKAYLPIGTLIDGSTLRTAHDAAVPLVVRYLPELPV